MTLLKWKITIIAIILLLSAITLTSHAQTKEQDSLAALTLIDKYETNEFILKVTRIATVATIIVVAIHSTIDKKKVDEYLSPTFIGLGIILTYHAARKHILTKKIERLDYALYTKKLTHQPPRYGGELNKK